MARTKTAKELTTMTGIRLWEEPEYHYLQEEDPADELHVWLGESEVDPEFGEWIRSLPAGTKVFYANKNGKSIFFPEDMSSLFNFCLNHYLSSPRADMLYLLFEAYNDNEHVSLIKRTQSKEERNYALRYHSDEVYLYPEVCKKCGCLMRCTRKHMEKRNDIWDKVSCTNHECQHVEITPKLLNKIRAKNQERLLTLAGGLFTDFLWKKSAEDIKVVRNTFEMILEKGRDGSSCSPGHFEEKGFCVDCGYVGYRRNFVNIIAGGDVGGITCCPNCFGGPKTSYDPPYVIPLPGRHST